MSRLIFVNKNKYDIFVPTPNGAGRRVKVGEAVEGDYFIDLANTGMLQRYMGDPASVEIICNYRLNSYLQASKSAALEAKATPTESVSVAEPAHTAVQAAAEVIPEDIASPLPVIDIPVQSILTPSEKDLYKLSLEELRMVAAAQGIDAKPELKKKVLIKMINAKSQS